MSNEAPVKNPKYSVISLIITVLTSLFGASVLTSGRGGGMEALTSIVPLIVFGGLGLIVAFSYGLGALSRGEPLGGLAVCLPPVAVLIGLALA